jgi:hypothetical protein
MNATQLRKTIKLLKEQMAELDQGSPDPRWRAAQHIANMVVRAHRLEEQYRKLKLEAPNVFVEYFEPVSTPTPKARELFKEMIALNADINRRLKEFKKRK